MKQVVRQVKERYKIDLHHAGIKYQLWRIDKSEYEKLRENSLPITDDFRFYMNLYLWERKQEDSLNLAEIFVTLEWLFGESSNLFDDWKGSFCFPILLLVEKEIGTFYYLMRIYDHRGSVYFSLYRIIENGIDGYNTEKLREPFEFEFSREEINSFLSYFYNYLVGCFHRFKPLFLPQSFFKKINSNLILYGYQNGQYFEEQYDSQDTYQAVVASFEEAYGSPFKRTDINAILQNITSKSIER